MGIEYTIKFTYSSTERVDALLRNVAGFADFDPTWRFFNYRNPNSRAAIPDGHARIESYGVYFCDNGGIPILPSLIEKITSAFGTPVVEEIE